MNYLFYDGPTGTSLLYTCLDSKRFKLLANYAANELGYSIPPAIINSLSSLITVGHFDLFLIRSAEITIPSSVLTGLTTAAKKNFPSFSMKQMTAFNQTGCPAYR